MQLAMVGLGRMGGNIVRRLMRAGHDCVVYDVSPDAVATLVAPSALLAETQAQMEEEAAAAEAASAEHAEAVAADEAEADASDEDGETKGE